MNSKPKIVLTSALVLGCAGITYGILKRLKPKNASDALNYLTIEVISTEEQCDQVITKLRSKCAEHHAVGFDCAWVIKHGKRQPVALLQLSTYDGFCALFRLCEIKSLPKSLKDLLEDNSIYKVGIGAMDNAKYLTLDYEVYTKATLDLRHLVDLCGYDGGDLAILSKSLLGVVLDKTSRIHSSDWAAEVLCTRQIEYAATDAHVAMKLFVKLINDYHKVGLLSWFQTQNDSHWENLVVCKRYASLYYKVKENSKDKEYSNRSKEKEIKYSKEIQSKRYPYAARKPLYSDCFLESRDGDLLCTCDYKKAVWYPINHLGEIVSEDPLTVRLWFEPEDRRLGDLGRYYPPTKERQCVVCGVKDLCVQKYFVPKDYMTYFPEIMKRTSCQDVLVLCAACRQLSDARDWELRERLALACDAPLSTLPSNKYKEDYISKRIRSAARLLLYPSKQHVLPEERRKDLESILLQFYLQHNEITVELLKEAADIEILYENIDESHGFKVTEYYKKNEGLLRLEEIWRQHFLDTMHPQYMPALWSVKNYEERLKDRVRKERRLSQWNLKVIGLSMKILKKNKLSDSDVASNLEDDHSAIDQSVSGEPLLDDCVLDHDDEVLRGLPRIFSEDPDLD